MSRVARAPPAAKHANARLPVVAHTFAIVRGNVMNIARGVRRIKKTKAATAKGTAKPDSAPVRNQGNGATKSVHAAVGSHLARRKHV